MTLHRALPAALLALLKSTHDRYRAGRRERLAEANLVRAAKRLSGSCLADVTTLEEWEGRRAQLRANLAWMLGLSGRAESAPPPARVTGVLDRLGHTVEKVVLESSPGLYVTANLLVPKGRPGPVPCVLYLCGHSPSLHGAKTGFQERYLWYPAHGFALLVVDPLEFGEVQGLHHGTGNLNRWDWLSLGYTPAGVEVWNAMRALDWLATRSEVDPSRIGVTGVSGGGVMTQYLAALDERVTVAAASCSTYTIGSQVGLGLVPQQCDCTFFPNVVGMDFPEVLALIVPRPLLILGGRQDPIFPPEGFREAYRRARKISELYRKPGDVDQRIRLVESGEGHADPPHFLRETRRWMARWLGEGERLRETDFDGGQPASEDPGALTCLHEAPAGALNHDVHRVWVAGAAPRTPSSSESWNRRRTALLSVLQCRVFGWFPGEHGPVRSRPLRNSGGCATLTRFEEYELETEPGVWVRVEVMTPLSDVAGASTVLWVRRSEDIVTFPDLDEVLPLLSTHVVVTVTPRFADRPLGGPAYARIERSAALVGRSTAALQVWDVLRVLEWARARPRVAVRSFVTLFGRGTAAAVALHAAILEAGVSQVVVDALPTSYRGAGALLTVLRDADLPEVAALLAPRPLIFLDGIAHEFAKTQAVYSLTGSESAIASRPSLASALRAESPVDRRWSIDAESTAPEDRR